MHSTAQHSTQSQHLTHPAFVFNVHSCVKGCPFIRGKVRCNGFLSLFSASLLGLVEVSGVTVEVVAWEEGDGEVEEGLVLFRRKRRWNGGGQGRGSGYTFLLQSLSSAAAANPPSTLRKEVMMEMEMEKRHRWAPIWNTGKKVARAISNT
eukprot:scaffold5682_cov52-Attheya_sp.AAC.1